MSYFAFQHAHEHHDIGNCD